MRIAFGIMAHKDANLLNGLIKQLLCCDACVVFVHLDSKSVMSRNDVIADDRVIILNERIAVDWGDFSQIKAINTLLQTIIAANYSFDYVTLLSGQDLLVRPVEELIAYLDSNSGTELYMDISNMPFLDWGKSGGFDRILYNYPKFFRTRYKKYHPLGAIKRIYNLVYRYNLIPTKSLPSGIEFWGGSVWFTVKPSLIRLSHAYTDENPWYDGFFKNSLTADEIYYATLYMHLADKDAVVTSNNLEYIDWNSYEKTDHGSPKTFALDDKISIESSDKFFARKFDTAKDNEIIDYFVSKTTGSTLNRNSK